MNRVDRAVRTADVMPVPKSVALEALALARERAASGRFGSEAVARMSAARTVSARNKTMPGPVLFAMSRVEAERA